MDRNLRSPLCESLSNFMKVTDKAQDLEHFVQSILSEKIKVGEVIRQSDLCEILGTSLSPLRELLVLLEELELVEVKPRAGYKIIYPDIEFMRENMQFRVVIEKHAIEPFVEDVADDWIDGQIMQHKSAIHGIKISDDLTALNASIVGLDRAFHRTLVSALKNKAMSKAHEYTQTKLSIARQVHRRIPPRKTNMNAMLEHITILNALKRRDIAEVTATLDAHFTSSIRNTLVGY
ncbi:MAG: GntR family transcriptional regulator [Sulfitobacter sp.]